MKKIKLRTLTSHTNAHAIRGRPSLKDVQRDFRIGPVHEAFSIDSKVLTSSHEIASSHEPNITENVNTINKTKTTSCTYAEMNKSDTPEVENVKKETFYEEDHPIMTNKKTAILDNFISSLRTQLQMIFLSQYFKIFHSVSIFFLLYFF